MIRKSLVLFALAVAATACASVPSGPVATLAFAEPAAPGGLPGSFRELDGKILPGSPEQITVAPGPHRVGYTCPNTIVLDAPPQLAGNFAPGARYLLRCHADAAASWDRR